MTSLKIACFLAMVACAHSSTTMANEPEPEMFTTSMEPEPGSDYSSTTFEKLMKTEKTTEEPKSMEGECVGNDSRCASADMAACKTLTNQGTDCKWVGSSGGGKTSKMKAGECTGNDSRCPGSKQATCVRLGSTGADCKWTSAFKAGESSGTCSGNDSRCAKKSETVCRGLIAEGTDCKWREAFSAQGSIKLQVTNADQFVNNAAAVEGVKDGISNVTKVPKEYIELDVHVKTSSRLLSEGRVLQTQSEVIVTYVITVGADAPADVAVTSDMVNTALSASNLQTINSAIVSKVESAVGTNTFAIAVQEVPAASVVVYAATTTEMMALAPEPAPESTSVNAPLDDNGALPLAAAPLLAFFGSCFYLF